MDIERRPGARSADAFLAGLEAGMLGICWMLLWMGISAKFQDRSFWTAENLMASVFYGAGAIRSGFAWGTVSGLALYLSVYSLLGALVALAVRDRLPRLRLLLFSLIFALAWYFASFHGLWEALSPLIGRLHVERATLLGHLIYGTFLSRYPVYLNTARPAAGAPVQPQSLPVPVPEPAEAPPPAADVEALANEMSLPTPVPEPAEAPPPAADVEALANEMSLPVPVPEPAEAPPPAAET